MISEKFKILSQLKHAREHSGTNHTSYSVYCVQRVVWNVLVWVCDQTRDIYTQCHTRNNPILLASKWGVGCGLIVSHGHEYEPIFIDLHFVWYVSVSMVRHWQRYGIAMTV